ncbi:hypothetical protein EMIHUDRAFT_234983 [Emiliania huxleyi CCMP1516]|uniref:UBX domain-containing protein n=2 Tax=Emiliania huxleyi TaxID=2903 RepID=A0A0D3JXI4_EMIH1|nr:hypothetical protein EMIHUDRAFT_234983 [Emiliania huxleyi CCMP1516]EOD28219.1 hypothetical protein EMIHUDRAFT_234983 [Emiliania huxleyi CCMP1516]|eukprot:XP_005780648.1 hypothetical protein EMIHUDRAFT_234983 [Emiliania huxleyi CCMP1516]
MSDDATHAFMETTGVNDPATAARALAAANGDLDAAVARHFDEEAAAGADDGTEAAEEAAAPPSLPMPESDLVGSILSNARQEGSEQGSEWSRPGRTLGGADSDAASTASAPVEPTRRNAKKLRRYEENKEFMEHLKRGVPPVELREFDLSSGAPLPRPVRLADGSRTTVRANKSHTLEALHAHIASLTPGVAFSLRAGFPPKRLGELGRTLEEAGLLNEAITQSKE